jgi:hypothetical protein
VIAALRLIALAAVVAPLTGVDAPTYGPPQLDALITEGTLDEISGVAASRRVDDLYWVHNDAPRPATLVALDGQGRVRGSVRIDGVRAVDWEDIASYTFDGKPWLLIGDIGDNAGVRKELELLAIEEPPLNADGAIAVTKPAWRLRFRFPDGAHDCEAMAVDTTTGEILLLTKRTPRPMLYRLPLGPGDGSVAIAERLLALDSIPAPTADERSARFPAARLGGSPTAMDIDAAGRRVAVLTYRDIWIFTRKREENWAAAFAHRPLRLPLPPLVQAEALGFDRSGRRLRVSGERLPAPWILFEEIRPGN